MLCLERLYKDEAAKKDREVVTINGRELGCVDLTECFQNKKRFHL